MAKKQQNKISITLIKSPIGYSVRQKATVKALGLRKMNHTVEHNDTDVIRGMVNKISHLVKVEDVK